MNPQEPYSVPTGVVPRLNREIVAEVQKHIDRLAPMIEDTTRVAPMLETDGPYGGAVIVSPISQREAVDTLVALAAAVDPVAKAVDDCLLMERKARAWDELRLAATRGGERLGTAAEVLAFMDRLVHPAQTTGTR